MTLARTPYARLSPADIGQVDRELKKLEQMSAGLYVPKVLVAARSPYTVQGTDTMLLCDCTAGAITLTFPLAARVEGMSVVVIKSDATTNAVTLSGTFSGGVNPQITVPHSGYTVVSMNGVYHVSAGVTYPVITGETGVVNMLYQYGDVRRYGAAVNNATNDATAVNNAVTSAQGIKASQGIAPAVTFPGLCKVSSTVTMSNAVILRGIGEGSGLSGTGITIAAIRTTEAAGGVRLENMDIVETVGSASTVGLLLQGPTSADAVVNWSLENVRLLGDRLTQLGTGISCLFALKGRVSGGLIQGWADGVKLDDVGSNKSNSNPFVGVKLRECTRAFHIMPNGVDDAWLTNCIIEGNTYGVYSEAGMVHLTACHLEQSQGLITLRANVYVDGGAMTSTDCFYGGTINPGRDIFINSGGSISSSTSDTLNAGITNNGTGVFQHLYPDLIGTANFGTGPILTVWPGGIRGTNLGTSYFQITGFLGLGIGQALTNVGGHTDLQTYDASHRIRVINEVGVEVANITHDGVAFLPCVHAGNGTTSMTTATFTTVFAMPTAGSYDVRWYLANSGTVYMGQATVIYDGTTAFVQSKTVGANTDVQISGANIQLKQTSGTTQSLTWACVRVV